MPSTTDLARRGLTMFRDRVVAVAALAVAFVAGGCVAVAPAPPAGPPIALEISAAPGLFPAFGPAVSDYVTRCTGAPVTVSVAAPDGTYVSVDHGAILTGRFAVPVPLSSGQSFRIVTDDGSGPRLHVVRCLPPGFPAFLASRTGVSQAQYYLTSPGAPSNLNYPAIYDTNGVPVWWASQVPATLATRFANGNLAWTINAKPAREVTLNGALARVISTSGGSPDVHDVIRLANGNYVLARIMYTGGIDMSSRWGAGYSSVTVLDYQLQEITPAGAVVWTWDVGEHIPATAMDPQWDSLVKPQTLPVAHNVYHWNSIEPTPTGYLLSFRALDAVYAIDRTTGAIEWKLGGLPEPGVTSLRIVGDPVFDGGSHFGGQHDARILADGTVTLFDNGTNLGRAPRAVRYQIDTTTNPSDPTATLVESRTDAIAPVSGCCGSARRMAGGGWLVGWGGTEHFSELAPDGTRVFRMRFPGSTLYRVEPIEPGVLDIVALRAAMDAQYP